MFDEELAELEANFTVDEAAKFCARWLNKDTRFNNEQRNLIMTTMFCDRAPWFVIRCMDHRMRHILLILLDLYEDGEIIERFIVSVLNRAKIFPVEHIKYYARRGYCTTFDTLIRITESKVHISPYIRYYSRISYKTIYEVLTSKFPQHAISADDSAEYAGV